MSALLDGAAALQDEEWQAATPENTSHQNGPHSAASHHEETDTLTGSDHKSAHQLPLNYNPFLSLEKDPSNNNNLSHHSPDDHLDQREDTATSSGGYNVHIQIQSCAYACTTGEVDPKQTGGWGNMAFQQDGLGHTNEHDESKDDLLDNSQRSEQFYTDERHSPGDATDLPRQTADFCGVKFQQMDELNNTAKKSLSSPHTDNSPTNLKSEGGRFSEPSGVHLQLTSNRSSAHNYQQYHSPTNQSQHSPTKDPRSFLDRMVETEVTKQQEAMQHTFSSVAYQHHPQAFSAQVPFRNDAIATPLALSNGSAATAEVNPFSLGGYTNNNTKSKEQVDGFFANPSLASRKQLNLRKGQSHPTECLKIGVQTSTGTNNTAEKSYRVRAVPQNSGGRSGVGSKVSVVQQTKAPLPRGSGAQASSNSGIVKIKRSQIESAPSSQNLTDFNKDKKPILVKKSNTQSVQDSEQFRNKPTSAVQQWSGNNNFGKTPFDQTLKPANDIEKSLKVQKFVSTQDPPLQERNLLPFSSNQPIQAVHQSQSQYHLVAMSNHLNSLEQSKINDYQLYAQYQASSAVSTGYQQQRATQSQVDLQKVPRRDGVFSPVKHARHYSEQKLNNSAASANSKSPVATQSVGGGVDSPKHYDNHGALKAAAKLGLMSNDILSQSFSPLNYSLDRPPKLHSNPQSVHMQFRSHHHQNSNEYSNLQQPIQGLQPPMFFNDKHFTPNLDRKISSQGVMVPQMRQQNNFFDSVTPPSFEPMSQAPIDHFPQPDGSFLCSQDVQHFYQAPLHEQSFAWQNNNMPVRNVINSGLTTGSQNISTAESGVRTIVNKATPSVSKNMPMCFRGKPSRSRPRVANDVTNNQDVAESQGPQSRQKQRSFSNDARIILSGNKVPPNLLRRSENYLAPNDDHYLPHYNAHLSQSHVGPPPQDLYRSSHFVAAQAGPQWQERTSKY